MYVMKSLRQILDTATKKSESVAAEQLRDLLNQYSQKMYSDGSWKMKTLRRKKWN